MRAREEPCGGDSGVMWLLRCWVNGTLEPEPVWHPPLPARATERDRKVAWLVGLLIGLRLADGDGRPVPCACREIDYLLDLGTPLTGKTASRSLRRLEGWCVFEQGDEYRSGQGRLVRTLRLPVAVDAAEGGEVGLERATAAVAGDAGAVVQPPSEVLKHVDVLGAEVSAADDVVGVAAGDGAVAEDALHWRRLVHDRDYMQPAGCDGVQKVNAADLSPRQTRFYEMDESELHDLVS